MPRIACFGEALIDFLALPAGDPAAPTTFLRQAGGAPANVAVAAATLGADAAFIGMLGADMFGDFLADSLQRAGVDTRWVRRTAEAKTALAFVSLDAAGERSFSFYRPPAADLLFTENDFAAVDFASIGVFHVCSNSLTDPAIARATLAGLRRARAAGALVSVDINWRPMLWPHGADPLPVVWSALELAHVVKASAEELALLVAPEHGGVDAVLARLWRAGVHWLIVTDGAAPVRWYAPAARGTLQPFATTTVDSTAAGDAFVGGLLVRLAEDAVTPALLASCVADDARRTATLRFAAACGALAVTRRGAFDAMPTRAAVEALLAAHSRPVPAPTATPSPSPDFRSIDFLRGHIAHTMAFYAPNAVDPAGGFFHYFRDDGSVYDRAHRHLVSSTRFVYNHAMAALEFNDATQLDLVRHGLTFLRTAHRHPGTGGYAWTLRDGVPEDRTNHCYGLAFVLLAYAVACRAGVAQARPWIDETRALLDTHFWEPAHGLYADEASADWSVLGSYRGQNANMHLCEALIAAYEATADQGHLQRALVLAERMTQVQAPLSGGLVWEHYRPDWQVDWDHNRDDPRHLFRPWGFQPGHQTEWAKLLLQLDHHTASAHTWLLPTARTLFDRAWALAWDAEHGGLFYGIAPDGTVCDSDKYFWVQAESLAAAARLAIRTGDALYWSRYDQLWSYAWACFVDHDHGAWYRVLRADNTRFNDEKSPAGKTDYHTMGACHDVLSVLRHAAPTGPVTAPPGHGRSAPRA